MVGDELWVLTFEKSILVTDFHAKTQPQFSKLLTAKQKNILFSFRLVKLIYWVNKNNPLRRISQTAYIHTMNVNYLLV